jgi:hypothetical protein
MPYAIDQAGPRPPMPHWARDAMPLVARTRAGRRTADVTVGSRHQGNQLVTCRGEHDVPDRVEGHSGLRVHDRVRRGQHEPEVDAHSQS